MVDTRKEQAPALAVLEDQPIMDGLTVLLTREDGLREVMVPIDRIEELDVPVDQDNIDKKIKDFKRQRDLHGGTGQRTPVTVGYVLDESKFRIVDGFHRYTVVRALGIEEMLVIADVMPLDELLDERISNAPAHSTIKFARIAEWMGESWSLTALAAKGIPITYAIGLAINEGLPGAKYKLTPEEADFAREWAVSKADRWNTPLTSLREILTVANNVDPALVHSIRSRPNASIRGETRVSPGTAKTLSSVLPGQHGHQQLVASAAEALHLPKAKVDDLAGSVRDMSLDQAAAYLEGHGANLGSRSTAKSFRYQEQDMLDPSARGTAIRPLLDVVRATESAIKRADISLMSPRTTERLKSDLELAASRVAHMLSLLEVSLEISEEDQEEYDGTSQPEHQSVSSFIVAVGEFFEGGQVPVIQNDEQLVALESILDDNQVVGSLDASVITRANQLAKRYRESRK